MLKLIKHIGLYFIMMGKVISFSVKFSSFKKQLTLELDKIGLKSIGIVLFISFFVGGVVSIQTTLNLQNPLLPKYLIGLASRDSLILEFSPTVISLLYLLEKLGQVLLQS